MGTRTAIFQQQENGQYKGIYIHYDGYIEGVGAMLHLAYQDRAKVKRLIDQEEPLANLGATGETVVITDYDDPRRNETVMIGDEELPRYSQVMDDDEGEYYLANNRMSIIGETFFTYNKNGDLQTYRDEKDNREYPLQGSDNNGFYYIQKLDGTWVVMCLNEYDIWVTKSLNKIFAK